MAIRFVQGCLFASVHLVRIPMTSLLCLILCMIHLLEIPLPLVHLLHHKIAQLELCPGDWPIGTSNHTYQCPQQYGQVVHCGPHQMKDHVLVDPGVQKFETSSLHLINQSEQLHAGMVLLVAGYVDRWIAGIAFHLLLYLHDAQPCEQSSNIDPSLDDLEYKHEEVGPKLSHPH